MATLEQERDRLHLLTKEQTGALQGKIAQLASYPDTVVNGLATYIENRHSRFITQVEQRLLRFPAAQREAEREDIEVLVNQELDADIEKQKEIVNLQLAELVTLVQALGQTANVINNVFTGSFNRGLD